MTQKQKSVPRIPYAILKRLPRLLHMEYKPSEISEELGVSTKTIYDAYIPAGLPHRRDRADNIWIIGTEFTSWVQTSLQTGSRYAAQRNKKPIGPDEGYCVTCKAGRPFKKITNRKPFSAGRVMLQGTCSVCGGRMNRIAKASS